MLSIEKIFEELLRLREADEEETLDFKSHSHDSICEMILEKSNILGDSFLKYESISYLVQGPRDQGVDVLLKVTPDDEPEKYIGIQVKSYNELEDRNNDLSKQLKAGYFDAISHYGEYMERYYILLCGDSIGHSRRISAITNEFSKDKKVRVIGARFAYNFIKLSPQIIAAIVDTYLRKEDYVRSKARKEVIEYVSHELYFVLCCLAKVLKANNDTLTTSVVHNTLACMFEEKFPDLDFYQYYDNFIDMIFEQKGIEGDLRFRIESFPGLRSLYYDLELRYEWPELEMIEHLYEVFRMS